MLQEIIQRVAEIEERATTKTIFGDPIREQGRTLIPVAKVTVWFGFGGGSGHSPEDRGQPLPGQGGAGGGGRMKVTPVATIDVTANGTKTQPIIDVTRLALAGLAVIAWNVFWISLTARTLAKVRR